MRNEYKIDIVTFFTDYVLNCTLAWYGAYIAGIKAIDTLTAQGLITAQCAADDGCCSASAYAAKYASASVALFITQGLLRLAVIKLKSSSMRRWSRGTPQEQFSAARHLAMIMLGYSLTGMLFLWTDLAAIYLTSISYDSPSLQGPARIVFNAAGTYLTLLASDALLSCGDSYVGAFYSHLALLPSVLNTAAYTTVDHYLLNYDNDLPLTHITNIAWLALASCIGIFIGEAIALGLFAWKKVQPAENPAGLRRTFADSTHQFLHAARGMELLLIKLVYGLGSLFAQVAPASNLAFTITVGNQAPFTPAARPRRNSLISTAAMPPANDNDSSPEGDYTDAVRVGGELSEHVLSPTESHQHPARLGDGNRSPAQRQLFSQQPATPEAAEKEEASRVPATTPRRDAVKTPSPHHNRRLSFISVGSTHTVVAADEESGAAYATGPGATNA